MGTVLIEALGPPRPATLHPKKDNPSSQIMLHAVPANLRESL
jgi:hypothetical protein